MSASDRDLHLNEVAKSSIEQLFDDLSSRPNVDPKWRAALDEARSMVAAPTSLDGPFLSVLLRTQGKRLEPLKDSLLCLAAQTDQDFEVIVLVHDATADAKAEINRIVQRQVVSFRDRITVVDVVGGHRGVPLNRGLEIAKGRYVAVYDDDDLVLAHWIESFREASQLSSRLLRSITATQRVRPEAWFMEQLGFRSLNWPAAEYAKSFDQLSHLLVNHSPFMSWAFPAMLFRLLGFRFDEEITVCEDWDLILTGTLVFGVTDVPHLTAIYRRWEQGESSYSRHSTESWAQSEQKVIDRVDSGSLLFAPGAMRQLRPLALRVDALHRYRFLFRGHELRPPLNVIWNTLVPFVRLGVRGRDWLRRRGSRAS